MTTYSTYPFGDFHWKAPIATASALPTSGNSAGDARIALDTELIYVWDGVSSWVLAGGGGVTSVTATSPLASSGGSTPNISISGGVLPFANTASIPLAITYYADKNRTDTYTADGTRSRPYKTIQAVFTAIATAAIADAEVDIIGPGYYAENVVINCPSLMRLVVNGHKGVNIQPASGLAWDWSTNNANMDISTIEGINFRGPVNIVGSADGASIWATDNTYLHCQFDQLVTVKNVVGIEFNNCYIISALAVENIGDGAAFLVDGHGIDPGATLSIVTNLAHAKPAGFSSTLFVADSCRMGAAITMDAGSGMQTRDGVRVGSVGDTFTINGTYTAYQSWVRADIVVPSGGTFLAKGTGWEGSLTVSGGTFTNSYNAPQLAYTPVAGGNWVNPDPTTVQQALDRIAAVVSVGGATPIP